MKYAILVIFSILVYLCWSAYPINELEAKDAEIKQLKDRATYETYINSDPGYIDDKLIRMFPSLETKREANRELFDSPCGQYSEEIK